MHSLPKWPSPTPLWVGFLPPTTALTWRVAPSDGGTGRGLCSAETTTSPAAAPSAVDPHARGAGLPRGVQVERPTGRTTWTPRGKAARLCLGRRRTGQQPLHQPCTTRSRMPAPSASEPERPRRRQCPGTQLAPATVHRQGPAINHSETKGTYSSNSPACTPATKAAHAPGPKHRAGPSAFLLSRTARSPSCMEAISTQLPLLPENEDFTQFNPRAEADSM